MAVVDSTLLLGIALVANYLFLYKSHMLISGIITIATGLGSYLIVSGSNPFGVIIIAIGLIVVFTAPWDTRGK